MSPTQRPQADVEGARFLRTLLGVFALAALLLAAAGVYDVATLVTAERTPEIGVRMALGARPRSVVGLIVRQSSLLALAGALAEAGAAAIMAPLMGSQLFGVHSHDPLTFTVVPLLLVDRGSGGLGPGRPRGPYRPPAGAAAGLSGGPGRCRHGARRRPPDMTSRTRPRRRRRPPRHPSHP